MLDDRQRRALLRRPNVAHILGGLQTAANLEQPVSRRRLYVLHEFIQQRRTCVDRWRHLPQERLQRLPRQPGVRGLCAARLGRAELGHPSRRADADDRICERERHGFGTFRFEQRCVTRDCAAPRVAPVMRDRQHLSLQLPIKA